MLASQWLSSLVENRLFMRYYVENNKYDLQIFMDSCRDFYISPDDVPFNLTLVQIFFNFTLVITNTINLQNLHFTDNSVVNLLNMKGLAVSNESLPYVFIDPIYARARIIHLQLAFSSLRFFDRRLKTIDTTCNSFLASYFDLKVENIKNDKVDKNELFRQLEYGAFGNLQSLEFDLTTVFDGPLCPLLFKNSRIALLKFNEMQLNTLVHHLVEFSFLNETFPRAAEIDINFKLPNLEFLSLYRTSLSSKTQRAWKIKTLLVKMSC